MPVENKQVKLAENAAAMERWMSKLLRAANELRWLRDQRKRLLKPVPVVKLSVPFDDPVPEFNDKKAKKRERDRAYRARKKAAGEKQLSV